MRLFEACLRANSGMNVDFAGMEFGKRAEFQAIFGGLGGRFEYLCCFNEKLDPKASQPARLPF
jgi:hypothetical protein